MTTTKNKAKNFAIFVSDGLLNEDILADASIASILALGDRQSPRENGPGYQGSNR